MAKPGPTISTRQPHQCATCKRPLPRRAYRRQCTSCQKLARGEKQYAVLVKDGGRVFVCRFWAEDDEQQTGDAR